MTATDGRAVVLENVWQRDVPGLREKVLSFWEEHGGPVGTAASERMGQLVFILRNASGEVVGASTALKIYVKQLRHYLFAFRMMIRPGYRIPGLASRLLVSTRDFLELIHKDEERDIPIGLITVVQNERIRKFRNEAIWPASKMVYIGNTAAGHHIRVYYFREARLRVGEW